MGQIRDGVRLAEIRNVTGGMREMRGERNKYPQSLVSGETL